MATNGAGMREKIRIQEWG
uniref:Uncharacterized protein n=1 Tax=Arundo donax TaxID=35708 RepID=A0A0A9GWN3_ARUDO